MAEESDPLLKELLDVIIRRWGSDVVQQALAQVLADRSEATEPGSGRRFMRPPRRTRREKITSALALVESLDLIDVRKTQLRQIALKYDERRFLPHLADLREFFAMRGVATKSVKDRLQGFRSFLEFAKELPLDALKELAASDSFSGPTRLGPISDAIKAAGDARRGSSIEEGASQEVGSDPRHVGSDPHKR